MATSRRDQQPDQDDVVQADPDKLSLYARELLDGDDELRRGVAELERLVAQFQRDLSASGTRVRLPNPLPSVLACLDDRAHLSTQIGRLAGAFDQIGDLHVTEMEP